MPENTIPVGGLQSLEELNDFEYIRVEFTTPTLKPKITLNYDNLTFNAACVRLFPETEYVQMLANRKKKRLLVWSCKQYDKDSVKWSIVKNNKPKSRNIRAKMVCAKVYKLMNWNINYRYKIMAVYQELGKRRFAVFNLMECEMYIPEEQTTNDGAIKKKRRKIFPTDWEHSFGTPFAEHSATYETDINELHLLSNSTPDDLNEKQEIIPRVPTSGEIITRDYYVPDDIIEKGKVK